MSNEIKTYSLGIIVEPSPALLLTYSYVDQETRLHKRLMPVRDLHRLASLDFDSITGVDVFQEVVDKLKQRHSLHLNAVDDSLLIKVIIVLCGLVNNRLELDQCLSHADRLLKDFKSDKESSKEPANGQSNVRSNGQSGDHGSEKSSGHSNGKTNGQSIVRSDTESTDSQIELSEGRRGSTAGSATGSKVDQRASKTKTKAAKQVRFREKHEEFIFERFDSEESDELIDNLNDKDFLDSMFKNDLSYEDLNNNYQSVNYN